MSFRAFSTLLSSLAALALVGCSPPAPSTGGGGGGSGGSGGGGGSTPAPVTVNAGGGGGSGDLFRGDFVDGTPQKLPFIVWGGDMATFYGNGGLRTREGSNFAERGLNYELVPGDDFDQQVEDYLAGRSNYLRGTFRMIGARNQELCQNPDTCPVIFMQMTWSAGDHLVAREGIDDLSDLRGKTVAVQRGGPHQGMLQDLLDDAQLGWDDINVVWADNLTLAEDNSPPRLFQTDTNIDAAFAITPDMIGLTGGLDNIGTGAEGTVEGASVLVSTAERRFTVADVYAVRADYYRENPERVRNFTLAYLESVEDVLELKRSYEGSGSDTYTQLMSLAVSIYGTDVLPNEEEAHGLLSDATFVGHAGNVAFFTDATNRHGFAHFNDQSKELAQALDLGNGRDLTSSPIDWNDQIFASNLRSTQVAQGARFNAEAVQGEIEQLDSEGLLDDRTVLSFTITFRPNQMDFSAAQYGDQYNRALEIIDKYPNAVLAVRGHSDPSATLLALVRAGTSQGVLSRTGTDRSNYQYFLRGERLDLNHTPEVIQMVQRGAFDGDAVYNPRETMQAALNLSIERAATVRDSFLNYATGNGFVVDQSQVQAQGVGIREPLLAKPSSVEEAAVNRRVEFAIVRVSSELSTNADFDF